MLKTYLMMMVLLLMNKQYVFQKLSCKTNWISEFVIAKKCICKLARKFDSKCCKYINAKISLERRVILGNSLYDLKALSQSSVTTH